MEKNTFWFWSDHFPCAIFPALLPRDLSQDHLRRERGAQTSLQGPDTLGAWLPQEFLGIQAGDNLILAPQRPCLSLPPTVTDGRHGVKLLCVQVPSKGKVMYILVKRKREKGKKGLFFFRRCTCLLLKMCTLTLCCVSSCFLKFLFWNNYRLNMKL